MEQRKIPLTKIITAAPPAGLQGSEQEMISALTADSRRVIPGALFVAKKGGFDFIPQAIKAGAVAIATERYHPQYPFVTQLLYPDLCDIEGQLAKAVYGDPSLFLVGITGTNGKTTTAYLIHHLFKACGLIGTVEWRIGRERLPSTHTTPDLIQNYHLFAQMREQGCASCVMEVSSHALDQGRVRGLAFDVAIFTNLTQDHLDYHQTMEKYAFAKSQLFSSLTPDKTAVINGDSSYADTMVQHCVARVMRYGLDPANDLRAGSIHLTAAGSTFDVTYGSETIRVHTGLIGRHNVYNLLAAFGAGLAKGLTLQEMACCFHAKIDVPGRLEMVPNTRGISLFVDYAHTEDALANVLTLLNEIKTARVITVFGCGGDRDVTKRSKMGAVVERLSDVVVVTSDNPRSEDPKAIVGQIMQGLHAPELATVMCDRQEAIAYAISIARPHDIILIAGKGHERGQIIGKETFPFDDREVAASLLCQQEIVSS